MLLSTGYCCVFLFSFFALQRFQIVWRQRLLSSHLCAVVKWSYPCVYYLAWYFDVSQSCLFSFFFQSMVLFLFSVPLLGVVVWSGIEECFSITWYIFIWTRISDYWSTIFNVKYQCQRDFAFGRLMPLDCFFNLPIEWHMHHDVFFFVSRFRFDIFVWHLILGIHLSWKCHQFKSNRAESIDLMNTLLAIRSSFYCNDFLDSKLHISFNAIYTTARFEWNI